MVNNSSPEYCSYQTEGQRLGFKYFKDNSHVVKPLSVTVTAVILAPIVAGGNGVIFWAIVRLPSLRTPANLLICCLSCIDALVGLLYLPPLAAWPVEPYNSYSSCLLLVLKSFTGWIFCSASFFIMVAVSCERYLALFHSLKYPSIVTTKRLSVVVTSIGVLSSVLGSLFFIENITKTIQFAISSILIAMGLSIIACTYTRIFKLVRRHHHQINAQQIGDTNNARQRKLAVTMAYVIGVSLICYLPLGIAFADIVIEGGFTVQNTGFFLMSELLFSTSSLCNPLIYCLKNEEIRGALLQLLRDMRNKFRCSQ